MEVEGGDCGCGGQDGLGACTDELPTARERVRAMSRLREFQPRLDVCADGLLDFGPSSRPAQMSAFRSSRTFLHQVLNEMTTTFGAGSGRVGVGPVRGRHGEYTLR